MIDSELKYFSKSWVERFRDHYSDSIESELDAFFSMYVIFDILVKEATRELILDRKICTEHSSDKMSAIKNISKYVGNAKLAKRFRKFSEHDIYELIYFCKKEQSYRKSKLIIDIEKYLSSDKKKDAMRFNKAILSLIYETREHLFQREIILENEKKYVLVTMSNILHTVIMALIKEAHPKMKFKIQYEDIAVDKLVEKIDK